MRNNMHYLAAQIGQNIGRLSRVFVLIVMLLISVRSGVGINSIQAKSAGVNSAEVSGIATLYHPFFEKSANTDTSLYLYNEDTQEVVFTTTFLEQTGNLAGQYTGSIGVGGFYALENDLLSENVNDGVYSIVISTDGEISSVARSYNQDTQTFSLHRGAPNNQSANTLTFGPFFNSAEKSSSIHLQNAAIGSFNLTAEAITSYGSVEQTINKTMASDGGLTISAADFDLPDDFTGWVQVTADQPVAGLLAPTSGQDQIGLYLPVSIGASQQLAAAEAGKVGKSVHIPRVYRAVSQGNGVRNTQLFVGNPEPDVATVTLVAYNPDGSVGGTGTHSVSDKGFIYLPVLYELLQGFAGSLVVVSDKDIVAAELTDSDGGDVVASYGSSLSFGGSAVQQLSMPYIGHGSDRYSILSIQNQSSTSQATVTMNFINQSGVQSQSINVIPANSPLFIDTRDQPDLADGFTGSVLISSDHNVSAYIDEYVTITEDAVPTPDPSQTATATPTQTATPEPTATPTPTIVITPTPYPTPHPTVTASPMPTPFIPITALLLPINRIDGDNGTSYTDPQTGEVVFQISQQGYSQITVQRIAACEDGSSPDAVTLEMLLENEIKTYTMSEVSSGLYEAVFSTSEIVGAANLDVEVVCGSEVRSARVGRIELNTTDGSQPLYLPIIHK